MDIMKFGQQSFIGVTGLIERIEAKEKQMCEIKFRVWDSHYNRWEERPCAINKKGVLFIYNVDSGEWFEPSHTAYKISWYTGLKDKNGKEGYASDIVSFGSTRPLYLIKWSICNAGFYLGSIDEQKEHLGISNFTVGEIIGNIHTTPELMEQENGK